MSKETKGAERAESTNQEQARSASPSIEKHTPGPWTYEVSPRFGAADGCDIRTVGVVPIPSMARQGRLYIGASYTQRDARLIAAAPELLETLKECVAAVSAAMRVVADLDTAELLGFSAEKRQQRLVDELHATGVVDGFGVRANAAIAKAEGRI